MDQEMGATLGQVLTWHRGLCPDCTDDDACPEYREITDEFTQGRQIWTGPLAASTTLSVREGTAT
jgi:hypothetical protein